MCLGPHSTCTLKHAHLTVPYGVSWDAWHDAPILLYYHPLRITHPTMMATKSGDSKSITGSPPSYNTIYNIQVKCRQPSVFSFLSVKQRRATALSRIRDLVSPTYVAPSSIESIVNAYVHDLTAAELSDLLQTPNIEGHTALYWAIVNHQREVFSAFIEFISKISFKCSSDLRLACMQTSDQASFSQLNFQNTNTKDESLRRFLGCPPDEIEVHHGGELDDHQFVASFRIRMFQKRLRATRELNYDFVARGRIWCFRFYMGKKGRWVAGFCLSSPSLPASPRPSLLLETENGEPGRETPPKRVYKEVGTKFTETLVSEE
ncbi:uncharacterized protein F5891DRAFT_1046928 [Suillus fuscotomentosus]|uniref:Uncharacterized protein n=1 Tax=Suillus fuscotomentosus TaxID=1912939 RepID=A0AAD4E374_9AGAM|nr:uncharacterized protein F5891DRAFT_1046928 [Suillus fuscotomentosus]KAG1897664.1 hypothetical protein F5891DRAFT_1046928 [Suillus fuscotomentosus]